MSGYELFNSNGQAMGGSDYTNLVFLSKVRLTTTSYSFSGLPSNNPQLVIGSVPVPAGGTFRVYASVSGHRCVEQNGRLFSDTIGAVFDCYSFGPIVDRGARNGFQLWSYDGRLTFDLERPFLKIIGVFTDPTPTVVPIFQNGQTGPRAYQVQTPFSAPSGKTYAYSLGNAHVYYYRTVTGSEARIITDHVKTRIANLTAGGVFDTAFMDLWIWQNPKAIDNLINEIANKTAPMRMVVVDVTGL